MKLRIKSNSVRLRLDRRDLEELIQSGRIEDQVRFGPGPQAVLSYAVEIGAAPPHRPALRYSPGRLILAIDRDDAAGWNATDLLGFDHEQQVDGGVVRVILEKDLACIDRPAGEAADDAWAFPNPASAC